MSDVIIDWNNIYLESVRKIGGAPCPIARAGAMMHLAMYEVVNTIRPTAQPYLSGLPTPDPNTSIEAAAIYAAHTVLCSVYPSIVNFLNDALKASLKDVTAPESDILSGKEFGEAVGNLVIQDRAGDGSAAKMSYSPGNEPGDWRPTGSGDALTPEWPNVKPFVILAKDQFRPPLPGGYLKKRDLLKSAEYAAQFNDVKRLGSANSATRTSEQRQIAFFWANDLDGTYKPPGHLFRLTQIVALQRNQSLAEKARLFALVGLALADAGVVAWDAKYSTEIDLWRPESAIRLADTDDNLLTQKDAAWEPLSVNPAGKRFSPPFPAYVSGHATFGAAHAGIMRNFFKTDNVSFELDTDDPSVVGVKRAFNSFSSAALENGRSRVYLGVHFQWDADHGYISGTNLADYVFANRLQELP
ncbi:MAG: phosphatase PAP2 family protein [Thermosynechococcaceae cyanobacterium MS004]|nr:phosphatase PAP2 family protein [Thermosynechococcaceae cyanobacterium MS004]